MPRLTSFFLPEEPKQQLKELTTQYCEDRKIRDSFKGTQCLINLIGEAYKELKR